MKRNIVWIIALTLTVMIGSTSCGKRQHIKLSKDTLSFSSQGGMDFFKITADCEWTIEQKQSQDWYSINPTMGSGDTIVAVTVNPNNSHFDRNGTITVTSANGRKREKVDVIQTNIDINMIINKVWFTRFYERWNTDYYNQYIEESYRTWTYYAEPEYENWFFYFQNDGSGYQYRTYHNDTIVYPFNYHYYPESDSLFISFHTLDSLVTEDYRAVVYELNQDRFVFINEYRPHQFEKINTVNVSTNSKSEIKINPKKVAIKPKGALIQVDN